ncbi:general odorant-binding protein 68 isoform X2 [Plodia interpunctella]|uniref:general odorant-binding protein 68 isoform X2 n=1 Tax=Plodia interpunctella TaxID=58824 RepID=UPI002368CF58|nr:general odorant-binding protein 68-like isoform X2 [Plodia interpunctella]
MLRLVFVAATVLQTISSQRPPSFHPNIPEQCRRPPQESGNPDECCKIPPIFPEEHFKECGFEKSGKNHPPILRGPPDCSKQLCILRKNGLLNDEDKINSDEAKDFLDKWGDSNTDLKAAIEVAKENCLDKEHLPGPPHVCEENKLFLCIKATLFNQCPDSPAWVKTSACSKLKDHMEDCAPFFAPPKK